MANHAEAGRHVLQLLGHVFAERRHRATARLAGFVGLRQVRSYVARQILRQRLALYLFRYRARCLGNLDGRSAFVGFEIFQFQFELLDLAIQFLGAAPECHTAQLRDQQLQVLDLGLARGHHGFV